MSSKKTSKKELAEQAAAAKELAEKEKQSARNASKNAAWPRSVKRKFTSIPANPDHCIFYQDH